MYVKQISVFLENSRGTLAQMTRLLGQAGIDLIALSIADTEHYGILRCIVTDTEKSLEVLKCGGFTVRATDVLAVCVEDRPGGLADILKLLVDADISVEYLYSFIRSSAGHALVIFHLSDLERGVQTLKEHGVRMLDADEIHAL